MKKSELRQMIREVLHEELMALRVADDKKLKEAATRGGNKILSYDTQLDFKNYYKRYTGEKNPRFYFDGVSCVDMNTGKDIPHIGATGELTYELAAEIIKKHFESSNSI